ncbi:MAG: aspartate aminotransferase family protein [Candidatus Aminicenantia bacterium]
MKELKENAYNFFKMSFLVSSYVNRGITFVKGENCYLIDEKGEKFLDLMTNYGVNIFGHNHPFIIQKIKEQLEKLVTLHCSFNNDLREEVAKILVERCGNGLSKVYFSNSGAEAIESALKFSVLATGKKKFLSCYGSFHGKTLGALSATFNKKYREPFEPLLWEFYFVPYNNLEAIEETLDESFSAFIVEPFQGEGGVNIPSPGYLKNAKKICDERGVLMIIDEIQTGFGRTGKFLASEEEIDNYDILCLGKGLGGGLPVGATLVSKRVSQNISKSIHSSTFGGNPLVCSGILASLELLNEECIKIVREKGEYFLNKLREIKSELIVEVRGKGFLLGVEVREKRDLILKELQKRKILAIPAGGNVVRFLPPYIIDKREIDGCVSILQEIFDSIQGLS